MAEKTRRERGLEMIKKVYAGDVVTPPEGNVFTDIMLEQVFAEQWARDVMSIRDRRILLLGIIAEKGYVQTMLIAIVDPIPWLRLVANPLSIILACLVVLSVATTLLPGWLERSGHMAKVDSDEEKPS